MFRRQNFTSIFSLFFLSFLLLPGEMVDSAFAADPPANAQIAIDPQRLNEDLARFGETAEHLIQTAADNAAAEAETDEQKAIVQRWQAYLSSQIKNALAGSDPRATLLDLWGVAAQLQETLDRTEDSTRLGKARKPVRETTTTINEKIRDLVKQYLPKEDYAKADASIRQYVKDKPFSLANLAGDVGGGIKNNLFSLWGAGKNAVGSIVSVPFLPGRAIGGIQSGVDQMQQFNATADRFTTVFEKTPEETRKQLSILLNQVADQQTTLSQLMTDLRDAAEAINQTTLQANKLTPEVQQAIRASGEAAAQYKGAADSIQGASAQTTRLVEAIKGLMPKESTGGEAATSGTQRGFDPLDYEAAARAIESGSAEVTKTIVEIQKLTAMSKSDASTATQKRDAKESHPFDVREYGASAESLARAAKELNALLAEIRSQSRTGDLDKTLIALQKQVDPIVAAGGLQARQVINHATWRAVMLMLLAFALGLGLLFAHHRWKKHP